MLAGGAEIGAAYFALRTGGAAVARAACYVAANGGKKSVRRLATTRAAYGATAAQAATASGRFGLEYGQGVVDDLMRGADWTALIPFGGLKNSLPTYLNACY